MSLRTYMDEAKLVAKSQEQLLQELQQLLHRQSAASRQLDAAASPPARSSASAGQPMEWSGCLCAARTWTPSTFPRCTARGLAGPCAPGQPRIMLADFCRLADVATYSSQQKSRHMVLMLKHEGTGGECCGEMCLGDYWRVL
jgi:hypothetical protein